MARDRSVFTKFVRLRFLSKLRS